jgi:hypothetical protein
MAEVMVQGPGWRDVVAIAGASWCCAPEGNGGRIR